MDAQRADRISKQFSDIQGCDVEVWTHGLLVRYGGQTSYFTREECFWPFVFRIACATEAEAVANIESSVMGGASQAQA